MMNQLLLEPGSEDVLRLDQDSEDVLLLEPIGDDIIYMVGARLIMIGEIRYE